MIVRAIAATIFMASALHAAEDQRPDTAKTYLLDPVTVTATMSPTKPEFAPQPVAQISASDVARRFTYNVGEMLDLIPGIRIVRSGATLGADYGVEIRSINGGPSSNKTLIMVDGRPMNNAWDGGVNFNSLPTELAERIEVVKGPASALYGSQATAGVINIITRVPAEGWRNWFSVSREFNDAPAITGTADDGFGRPSVHAYNLQWQGSYRDERATHTIAAGYRNAQNTFNSGIDNAWNNADATYGLRYALSDVLTLNGGFNYHWNKWHNEADATPTDDEDKIMNADLGARYSIADVVINGRAYMNSTRSTNTILKTALNTGSVATRTGLLIDAMVPVRLTGGILHGGVDAYLGKADVDYSSTVMDVAFSRFDTVLVKGKKKLVDLYTGTYGSNAQSFTMNNVALFVQYEHRFVDRINVVAGARLDRHSAFGTVVTPKAGLTFDVLRMGDYMTTLKANYGTGFRAPAMVDLYSKSLSGYGNTGMNPEKVESVDLGVFQRFGDLGYLEVSWYRMHVTDLMINDKLGLIGNGNYVLVPNASGRKDTLSFNQRRNLGSYSPSGVEISLKVNPEEHVAIRGGFTYLDPEDFTFQTSKYRWNVAVSGWYQILGAHVEAELIHSVTGEGYFFDYHTDLYPAFSTTDVTLSADITPLKVTFVGKNLADTRYRLWKQLWQPGRTFAVRLETRF